MQQEVPSATARRLEVLKKAKATQRQRHPSRATHTAHRHTRKSNATNGREFQITTHNCAIYFRRCLDRPSADQAATPAHFCWCSFSLVEAVADPIPHQFFFHRRSVLLELLQLLFFCIHFSLILRLKHPGPTTLPSVELGLSTLAEAPSYWDGCLPFQTPT